MTTISLKLKVPLIFAVISLFVFLLAAVLLGTNSIRQIELLQDSQLTLFISNHRFEFLDGKYSKIFKELAPEPYLDQYYKDYVIGGPGSFMIAAKSFETFGEAILMKMIVEIADRRPPTAERLTAAAFDTAAPVRK